MIINPFRLQRYIKNPELPSNSGDFCDNIVFLEGIHSLLRCLLYEEKGFPRENNGKTRKEIEEWHFSLKKFGDMKYYCYFCAKIQEYEIKR